MSHAAISIRTGCTVALFLSCVIGCYDFSRPATDVGTDGSLTDVRDENAQAGHVRTAHLADPQQLLRGQGKPVALKPSTIYRFDTDAQTLEECASENSSDCTPSNLPIEVDESEPPLAPTTYWFVDAMAIPNSTVMLVRGARALAIVAVGEVVISGSVDASARGRLAGPGAATGANCALSPTEQALGVGGCGNGSSLLPGVYSGGGGGGHLQPGGTGGRVIGKDDATANSGSAGAARTNEHLDKLVGGGGGGPGGRPSENLAMRAFGGGGGGALQITSNTSIQLDSGAQLLAVGGGGSAPSDEAAVGGGGGGGAGGLIFLQAPKLDLRGSLIATGGGGGGGDAVDDTSIIGGSAGSDGSLLADQPAMGGTSRGGNVSNGGQGGGNGAQLAGDSSAPIDAGGDGASGGGGGAAGRLVAQGDSIERADSLRLLPNQLEEQDLQRF